MRPIWISEREEPNQAPGGGRIGGGGPGGGDPGFIGGGGYPWWWYSMWAFVAWVNSITTDCMEWGTNEGPCTGRPTRPPILH